MSKKLVIEVDSPEFVAITSMDEALKSNKREREGEDEDTTPKRFKGLQSRRYHARMEDAIIDHYNDDNDKFRQQARAILQEAADHLHQSIPKSTYDFDMEYNLDVINALLETASAVLQATGTGGGSHDQKKATIELHKDIARALWRLNAAV
jgi:hypothetical protein